MVLLMRDSFILAAMSIIVAAFVVSCSDSITTQLEFGSRRVAGRVIGGLGLGIDGAHVTITGRFGMLDTVTLSNGSYSFEHLPDDGLATLTATSRDDTVRTLIDLSALTPFPITLRLPRWELAWSDEFDGDHVDRRWWHVWNTPSEQAVELAVFDPNQVTVSDGLLRIRTDAARASDGKHPSGGVASHYYQRYGRFEIRARLPRTQGLWSAHWIVNSDSIEPVFEVDIMELLGHNPNRVYFHNHFNTSVSIIAGVGSSYSGEDFSADFHTFRLDWYVGNLIWYVDGIERFRSIVGVGDRAALIRINTQVGGSWGGPPDKSSTFPQFHDVDWVRVYSLAR